MRMLKNRETTTKAAQLLIVLKSTMDIQDAYEYGWVWLGFKVQSSKSQKIVLNIKQP